MSISTPASAPDTSNDKKPMSNLAQRVLYGAIGAAALIGCIWYSAWTFALFFAVVQARMLWEFYRMMKRSGYAPAALLGMAASLVLFMGVAGLFLSVDAQQPLNSLGAVVTASGELSLMLRALLLSFLLLLPLALIVREMIIWPRSKRPFANVGVNLIGLFYVSVPMTLLVPLAYSGGSYDYRRILALLLLVWAADTGAYAAGKNFGKHKLAPSISPGKTWEGWIGGTLLTLVVGWALGYLLPEIPLTQRLVVAAVVAVFGVLGDLAESMLKRSVGVKDSGRILPGHGGLLDRFDAFLFILPVLLLLQVLLG
ncbi:phosphatidate cytidylyltransferase [Hymenobacter sp. DG25B]|uniref:phosphatidate cytidylyltransferase n=1 Tax=Hymenobacter sp. DG25B TaxID=1385664 RepID=UPI000AA42A7C|nr:phosphatidate cytidylyltransferase [Hymenobacter sp. DG25B]